MVRGALYVASGNKYIKKAERSAASLKKHNPDLPVTIYSDKPVDSSVFDNISLLEKSFNSMGDSILSEQHFPYEQTLYLDVDTYICGRLDSIFQILDEYDFTLARDTGAGIGNRDVYKQLGHTSQSFIEYNTGVIGYNDCTRVQNLFMDWRQIYDQIDFSNREFKTNQPALTIALLNSEVKFITLPSEYNFQMNKNRFAKQDIRILHRNGGAKMDFTNFKRTVNSHQNSRIITLEDYPCRVFSPNYRSKKFKIKKILSKRTWQRLAKESENSIEDGGFISLFGFYLEKAKKML